MQKLRGLNLQDKLDKCILLAKNKHGKCLSEKYINTDTKMLWQCRYGHRWEAIVKNVLYKNKWCPYCSKNKKLTIEYAHELAEKRNAKCLSKEYINSGTNLKWECEQGHIFLQSLNNINSKYCWCPYCKFNQAEEICRKYFKEIFKCNFVKSHPYWLTNDDGNKLELDGLSEKTFDGFKIAFEHNGKQHYDKDYFRFLKKEDKERLFTKIQKHDKLKIKLCKENNVLLFVIPHIGEMINLSELDLVIKKQADNFNLKISIPNNIDFNEIYLISNRLKKI